MFNFVFLTFSIQTHFGLVMSPRYTHTQLQTKKQKRKKAKLFSRQLCFQLLSCSLYRWEKKNIPYFFSSFRPKTTVQFFHSSSTFLSTFLLLLFFNKNNFVASVLHFEIVRWNFFCKYFFFYFPHFWNTHNFFFITDFLFETISFETEIYSVLCIRWLLVVVVVAVAIAAAAYCHL